MQPYNPAARCPACGHEHLTDKSDPAKHEILRTCQHCQHTFRQAALNDRRMRTVQDVIEADEPA